MSTLKKGTAATAGPPRAVALMGDVDDAEDDADDGFDGPLLGPAPCAAWSDR